MAKGISFFSALKSAVANATFFIKNADYDEISSRVVLKNVDEPESGVQIDNTQRYINELGNTAGITEGDAAAKIYSSTEIIADGDDRKTVVEKLDAQVGTNLDKNNAQDIRLTNTESATSTNTGNIATNVINIGTNDDEIQAIEDSVGAANGICPLDANQKVDLSNLPDAVLGNLKYQGAWNASTNTPALISSVGTLGHYYIVSVSGTTDLDGETDWENGDWAVFNGTVWEKADNSSKVTSVNTKVGAVVLDKADIGLPNVTNDAQLKRSANDIITFIEKAVPVDGDVLIIEDSEDSFNKKKVNLANMIGGSGGVGSPSIYKIFNAEDGDDITPALTGNDPAFLGGGAMIGTLSESLDPINGEKSYLYSMHAVTDCTGDYAASEGFDMPIRSQDRDTHTFKMSYRYAGNDGDINMVIYNSGNAEILKEIPLKASFTTISQIFDHRGTSMRIGFHVKNYNASKTLRFDDIVLDDEHEEPTETYIENSSASRGVGGWFEYNNTTAADKPDDFAGALSVNFSLSTSEVDPIAGKESFLLTLLTGIHYGRGLYYDGILDKADLAAMLMVVIYHTGNMASFKIGIATTVIGDWSDTETAYAENGGNLLESIRTLAPIQTGPTAKKFRLVIHCVNQVTTSDPLSFDRVSIDRQEQVTGQFVEDEIVSFRGYDSGTIPMVFSNSDITKAKNLMSIDAVLNRITFSSDCNFVASAAFERSTTTAISTIIRLRDSAGNSLKFARADLSTTSDNMPNVLTFHATTGDYIEMELLTGVPSDSATGSHFTVKATKVHDNARISTDYGNAQITAYAAGNGGGAITADSTKIDFTSVAGMSNDWDGDEFNTPENGFYVFSGEVLFGGSIGDSMSSRVDGLNNRTCSDNPTSVLRNFSGMRYLKKGEKLSFTHGATTTLSNVAAAHHLSIIKFATPESMMEGAKVFAHYKSFGGQSIPAATLTTLIFSSKVSDSAGLYNTSTGIITAKKSGCMKVKGILKFANAVWDSGTQVLIKLYNDTTGDSVTLYHHELETNASSSGIYWTCMYDGELDNVIAGDGFKVQVYQNYNGVDALLTYTDSDANRMYISQER